MLSPTLPTATASQKRSQARVRAFPRTATSFWERLLSEPSKKRAAPNGVRLMSKHDVLDIIPVTFVTIWKWMRAGKFPRALIVHGKSMWRSDDIEAWIAALPVRPLKGDANKQQKDVAG
jgi:predicted DNA-binding transcriptional regulator AlpA